MTLEELANQIDLELDGQSNKSQTFIIYILRQQIGQLNILLGTSYNIDGTDGSINPDLDEKEAAILKCLFYIYYFDDKIRSTLNAASVDSVISVSENGQTIKLLNKNESSKLWSTAKKDQLELLSSLVAYYKLTGISYSDVAGDDDTEGTYPN